LIGDLDDGVAHLRPERVDGGNATSACPGPTGRDGAVVEAASRPAGCRSRPGRCQGQVRGVAQLTTRPRPAQYGARSLNFWTLPVAVRSSASRSTTLVGAL